VLRLQVNNSTDRWRSFRWTVYLLLAGVAPVGVSGALYVGPGFGTALVGILAFCYGMSIFGVEFTIRMGKQTQIFEFDAAGIQSRGGGLVPRVLLWRDLSRVRLRTGGPPGAPTSLVFVFRAGLLLRILVVDLINHRDIAERVAGFVARYASNVRRVGRLEAVRWDPSLATDGDISTTSPEFEPLFYSAMAVAGPSVNVLLTGQLLLIGVLRAPVIGVGTVAAYVVLGLTQITYCWREVRRISARRGSLPPDWRVRGYFAAGVGFVIWEGLFGLRVLL